MPSSKTPRSFGHGRAGGQAAEPYPTSPEVRKFVRLQNRASPGHVAMDQTHEFSEDEGGPRRDSSASETDAYDSPDSTGGATKKEKATRRECDLHNTQEQEVRTDKADDWCRIREQHGDEVSEVMLTNSNSAHAQDAGIEKPVFGAASVSAFVEHSKWNRCDVGGEDKPGDFTSGEIDAAIDGALIHDTIDLATIQWDQYSSADVLRAPPSPQMDEDHNAIHDDDPMINYALLPPVNLSERAVSKQIAAGGAPVDAIVAANPEMKHQLREECHTALNTYDMPYAGMQYPAFTPVPSAVDATALNTYSAPFTSMQHPAFAPVHAPVDATISNIYSTPHADMWYPPLTPMSAMEVEMLVAHVLASTAQITPLTIPGDDVFAPAPAVDGYAAEMSVANVLIPHPVESTAPGDDSTTEEAYHSDAADCGAQLAVDYASATPVDGDVAPKQARKASTSNPTTHSHWLQDTLLEAQRTPQGGHGTEPHVESDQKHVYEALPKPRIRGKKAKLISYAEGLLRGLYPPTLEVVLISGQIQCAIPGCGMSFDTAEWTFIEVCEHLKDFHYHLITLPPNGQERVRCPCHSLGCLKTFIAPDHGRSSECDIAKVIARHLIGKHLKHRGYTCPLCKSKKKKERDCSETSKLLEIFIPPAAAGLPIIFSYFSSPFPSRRIMRGEILWWYGIANTAGAMIPRRQGIQGPASGTKKSVRHCRPTTNGKPHAEDAGASVNGKDEANGMEEPEKKDDTAESDKEKMDVDTKDESPAATAEPDALAPASS
ncbi:hypothetical protein PHLGIDRAFT_16648 [Phlebiopsis gigantea 11061_1 CR5-6]|uniref:Uncharacterized protein n=1 Tax=Phlebiopsis gigantea (strain 11061_1 CR5-6) TaxID=745531 RepID=A0A0C3S067_PHLG1|nr:hypothetical protein PHLGIDRAFT_16648 [Phlebiopsis gigantea 11061_1 CR5-6]